MVSHQCGGAGQTAEGLLSPYTHEPHTGFLATHKINNTDNNNQHASAMSELTAVAHFTDTTEWLDGKAMRTMS